MVRKVRYDFAFSFSVNACLAFSFLHQLRSQRGLFYYTVKISLNSNIARILSLAEVKVFGDYYNFDVSFGALFNLSKRTVNRIVFIQDGLTGKSTISDITLVKKPVEPISVSVTCDFYAKLHVCHERLLIVNHLLCSCRSLSGPSKMVPMI